MFSRDGMTDRLIAARVKSHMTQEALSQSASIAPQVIQALESGTSIPDAECLYILADALDTSADYLLGLSANRLIVERLGDCPEDTSISWFEEN